VAGYGDAVGLAGLLRGGGSPETTIALNPIRALSAGPDEFRELVVRRFAGGSWARFRLRAGAAELGSTEGVDPGG